MEINTETFLSELLNPATTLLESATNATTDKFPKPEFTIKGNKRQWRYKEPRREHACIIRAVAIVSGLNSTACLLQNGYYQEINVIKRTLIEFNQDIHFLLIGYNENILGDLQKQFLDELFKEEFLNQDIPSQGTTKKVFQPRKKILAAISREIEQYSNPTDIIKMQKITTDIYSGYIHGAYAQLMDLYGGEPPNSKFHMRGCLNTPRIYSSIRLIAACLNQSIVTIGTMCAKFSILEMAIKLMDLKKEFEAKYSELFPSCQNELDKYLIKLKKGKEF